MECFRCHSKVFPNQRNIEEIRLNHLGVANEAWMKIDALLYEKGRANGWQNIKKKEDMFRLFILSQIVYNKVEGCPSDCRFLFPDETDFVKILWKEECAIGFYSVKTKDSIVFDTMESYEMTTLDTAYIRKMHRQKGFGVSILEDVAKAFPNEPIGISTPISTSMYHVAYRFLIRNPWFKNKLWEITGVGSEGDRKLIYFTLKNSFQF